MKTYLTFILASLITLTSSSVFADCQQDYTDQIHKLEDHLLFAHKRERKILKRTFIGVSVPSAIFWGTMFGLVTDGATIPISILQGALFGSVFGGAAVGAVAVPIVTYNQILKANIRSLKKTQALLQEASEGNQTGKEISRLMNKLDHSMSMDDLIREINTANSQNLFCQTGDPLYRRRHIKKYLLAL